ncbi:MAG: thioredoxin family protein [Ignavibacteria bacterium]|nr:thioredoxin family protein [Ignavibacteria bacterium]
MIEELNRTIDHLTQIATGDTVRSFTALTEDSALVIVDPKIKDQKMLLLVFATWCKACKGNMHQWNLLADSLIGYVNLVGLTSDSLFRIHQYKTEAQMRFETYSVAHDFNIMKRHKLLSFPKTILVDTTGIVLNVWTGTLSDPMRSHIQRVVLGMK